MSGDLTLRAKQGVRIDLGTGKILRPSAATVNKVIDATGTDIYYSGASTGNNVNIKLGVTAAAGTNTPATVAGVFTHVVDATPVAGATTVTINSAYSIPAVLIAGTSAVATDNKSGIKFVAADGTTEVTTTVIGKGVRYADNVAVTITDDRRAEVLAVNANKAEKIKAVAYVPAIVFTAKELRWIEGGSINVTGNAGV